MNDAKKCLIDNNVLMREWDYERNKELNAANLNENSYKKVWWVCSKGHEWKAEARKRVNDGNGCPYCNGKKVLKGFNDLNTKKPLLSAEWNWTKNKSLTPFDITPASNKKVWWICSKGHEWQATISHRVSGTGCPYCKSKNLLKEFNDLATINPKLSLEWNYDKSKDLVPTEVMSSVAKRVWWKCFKGHEWQATINSKNRGSGCPTCYYEKSGRGKRKVIQFDLNNNYIDIFSSITEARSKTGA